MPHIPKMFCAACGLEMVTAKSGHIAEVVTSAGTAYYKVMCDLYSCLNCGMEVHSVFGLRPLSEHFHSDYGMYKTTVKLRLRQ